MEILRILFVLGFLAPGYYAMEIQPSVLPRNLDVYCKFCDGLSSVFDNFSYEDYDFWRTIDIQEKVRFFCSFCKKKTESTTMPTTTTSSSPRPETTSSPAPATSETPSSSTENSSPASATPSSSTESTSPASSTPSTSTQNSPPAP